MLIGKRLHKEVPLPRFFSQAAKLRSPCPGLETSSLHCGVCRGAADWYHALPPITKGLLTCYLVTGLSLYAGILPIMHMYHDYKFYFKKFPEVGLHVGLHGDLGCKARRAGACTAAA